MRRRGRSEMQPMRLTRGLRQVRSRHAPPALLWGSARLARPWRRLGRETENVGVFSF